MSAQSRFAEIALAGGRAALVTVLAGPQAGEHLLVGGDGTPEGTFADPELERRALAAARELLGQGRCERRDELFIDVVAPPPRLLIFGAVECADYLSQYARIAGWRPWVIDPRARFAEPRRFPHAIDVIVAWPDDAIGRLKLDCGTYVVVLTHDSKIDDQVLTSALAADPAYIGAMGSRRTQEARSKRLVAAGVDESEIARISAPIGLDIGAVGAQEVAISIFAELLAVRHGRAGGRLSASARGGLERIH